MPQTVGDLLNNNMLCARTSLVLSALGAVQGGCAVSWIGDLFSIPEMVREANADPRWLAVAQAQRAGAERPPFATGAFVQALTVAYVWAQLFRSALPDVDVLGGMVNLSSLHWALPAVVAVGE